MESKLLYRLSLENLAIVRPIGCGLIVSPATGALLPYFAMEWLDGDPLSACIRRWREEGRLPSLQDTIALLDDAVQGLAAAHALDVTHRDVKPGNILMLGGWTMRPRTKLLDFGVAKNPGRGTHRRRAVRNHSRGGGSLHARLRGSRAVRTDVRSRRTSDRRVRAGAAALRGHVRAPRHKCSEYDRIPDHGVRPEASPHSAKHRPHTTACRRSRLRQSRCARPRCAMAGCGRVLGHAEARCRRVRSGEEVRLAGAVESDRSG